MMKYVLYSEDNLMLNEMKTEHTIIEQRKKMKNEEWLSVKQAWIPVR